MMIIQWKNEKEVIMQAGGLYLTIRHNKEDMDVRVFRSYRQPQGQSSAIGRRENN